MRVTHAHIFKYVTYLAQKKQNTVINRTHSGGQKHLRDRIDHVKPHLDAAARVIGSRLRQSGHAVVAVTQDLNAEAVVILEENINSL